MKKIIFLRIINVLMVLCFFLTVLAIVFYLWIPGEQQGSEWLYSIHINGGKAFIVVAVSHIVLNWGWIKINYFKKRRKK